MLGVGGWRWFGVGGVFVAEEVASGVVVALALGEQVPRGGEYGVFVGDDGLDLAARRTMILL